MKVALICHEDDKLDAEGLASWLGSAFDLVGVVALREGPGRLLKRVRWEIRRSGILGFMDVLAFRGYYRVWCARSDASWVEREVARLRARFPTDLDKVPRHVAASPNTEQVRSFLAEVRPDVVVARCKVILRREVFEIPRQGTLVFHPGICPEYRNAHGCFWALARRDFDRVGMTLLRVDEGIDTGPSYLYASYPYDEVAETHFVIQQRMVTENLDLIAQTMREVAADARAPIPTQGRVSRTWGQPRLSAYLAWKRAARRRARA